MADSSFIVDVTRDNFQQVMEASFKVPVLLDFWASWCQPCQVLTPILAKLADEYEGKFLLGKLNTEEEQEIAAQFGIRSIPTVKLFRDGRPVDEFMGAQPESTVRQFIDKHVGRASDAVVQQAQQQLAEGNAAGAIVLLDEARETDPDNPNIPLKLAQAHAMAGDIAAAEAALDSLPADAHNRPEVAALRSHLFFEGEVADTPPSAELEARLEANPDDSEARAQLALRRVVERDYEAALQLFLELMQKDRQFGDDAGRRGLLQTFELLGDHPLVGQYRRRMANLLY